MPATDEQDGIERLIKGKDKKTKPLDLPECVKRAADFIETGAYEDLPRALFQLKTCWTATAFKERNKSARDFALLGIELVADRYATLAKKETDPKQKAFFAACADDAKKTFNDFRAITPMTEEEKEKSRQIALGREKGNQRFSTILQQGNIKLSPRDNKALALIPAI